MGIKIITDSACDLTKEYIESENIGLVSLILNLNGKLIKEREKIHSEELICK